MTEKQSEDLREQYVKWGEASSLLLIPTGSINVRDGLVLETESDFSCGKMYMEDVLWPEMFETLS